MKEKYMNWLFDKVNNFRGLQIEQCVEELCRQHKEYLNKDLGIEVNDNVLDEMCRAYVDVNKESNVFAYCCGSPILYCISKDCGGYIAIERALNVLQECVI